VLFVGNSLLLEGVLFEQLRDGLATTWDARRLVAERTSFYDWYYGLKRLFREGARPDVVVVMLSSRQWIEDEFRGDYSAHFLMDTADLIDLGRDLRLHPTKTSNLLLAHMSRFWGSRSELRNYALQFAVPDLGVLVDLFTSMPNIKPLRSDDVEAVARARIARMRALTEQYDARLVLLVPPTLSIPTHEENGWLGLQRAGEAAGIAVVTPRNTGTFAADAFRDAGFHLNPRGAKTYTERLLPVMRDTLTRVMSPIPNSVQTKRQDIGDSAETQ
jgi:muconolactone delta-isomerase